ncbi:type I-G CRISPR-associated helicase/endonuclease Cas3g [Marichromatium bheemlicum]|uniref:Type I-U CRISPR-associated helicase/endonuclease Cas3 n=1 Tax=Marichromatium bheemlicum TaxID=365339 RepID=A0ABX1IA49_9GAMM|nr:type I-U CRISPR-associated helicase/endonuclease Cas3 [Marichromatium bheemlicum]NKN34397.1 type I-U CRISPR-associated helicase/endonuclease Cas3 [Marichromatium bheemlicum]
MTTTHDQSAESVDFDRWYRQRHGYSPFPWQSALAARVAAGDWPEALTAPTGCGKTAIIDVWLWARLCGHGVVPRRLVYVIDRRLVVDGVSDYVERLIDSLPVSDRPGLARLRGGITIDEDWLADPRRPAVLVSTIDQVGSRLLFSGYGVSPRSAPIHAGLLGNDVLFVLDEVHLAQPFLRTLARIQALRGEAIALPWRVLVMSATWTGERTHGLTDADLAHPVLASRLHGAKPARLVKLRKDARRERALVDEARAMRAAGAGVIGVVCNQVARARAVFEALHAEDEAVLLTGRVRPGDRAALLETTLPRIAVGSREAGRAPLYVVATQTIEVGADLDLDALVTECAPLSALRQRAGRLNRIGELASAPMAIVHRLDKHDPVYGPAVDDTWRWLSKVASGKPKHVDFGLVTMAALMEAEPPPEESAPASPLLLDAHVEMLSRTGIPHRIEVAPWLHGWERGTPDVYLCWRAELADPDPSAALRLAPPMRHELLAVPLHALRRWNADIADVEGTVSAQHPRDTERWGRPLWRWDGEAVSRVSITEVRVGDTLILPPEVGGCDRYGWAPDSSATVVDLGDGERRVRLHPKVHPELAEEISALLDAETTTAEQWRALARRAGLQRPGRVFAHARGCVVLAESAWSSHGASRPVALAEHSGAVGARVEAFARGVGLDDELVDVLRRAGCAHDLGKADPRWQAMVGGDVDAPLAKGPGGDDGWLTLPRGWRHEMASAVRQREPLLRHLVGTHHGLGRPLLPCAPDPALWRRLDDWPEVFAALQRRFGPWGLAYLEALLRLADWSVSEEEQRCD